MPEPKTAIRRFLPHVAVALALTAGLLFYRYWGWSVSFARRSFGFVALSDDGRFALTYQHLGACEVWECRTGQSISSFEPGDRILSGGFSPDCSRVVTGNTAGEAEVWDVSNGKRLAVLTTQNEWVYDVSFGPDGDTAVTVSGGDFGWKWDRPPKEDAVLGIWNVNQGTRATSISMPGARSIGAVFSPGHQQVLTATSSENGVLRLWDVETGALLRKFEAGNPWSVCLPRFSPDGKRIVANVGGETHVWDVETGNVAWTVRGHLLACHFSETASLIVTNPMDRRTAKVYDIDTGEEVLSLPHGDTPTCGAFSPDGARVATGGKGKRVHIWQVQSGRKLSSLSAPVNVRWIVLFADEDCLLTVSDDGSFDPPRMMTVRYWTH